MLLFDIKKRASATKFMQYIKNLSQLASKAIYGNDLHIRLTLVIPFDIPERFKYFLFCYFLVLIKITSYQIIATNK